MLRALCAPFCMLRVDERAFMRELSLHVLDALENSLEAGATCIELVIEENMAADRLSITIRDNGRGMDKAQLDRIFDPFFTTRSTRHVGLGVPLFKAAAERCNGNLTIASQPGEGTVLQAGLYPFIIGDLIKMAAAALALPSAWLLFRRFKG